MSRQQYSCTVHPLGCLTWLALLALAIGVICGAVWAVQSLI